MGGVAVLVALGVLDAHQVRVGLLAEVAGERQYVVAGVAHRFHNLEKANVPFKLIPARM